MKKEEIKWLIWLHQGWLEIFWPYFPPFVAVAILLLVTTGLNLLFLELQKWSSIPAVQKQK
jgi:hypothetical protein